MNRRVVIGFLVAPLVPCVLAATVASLRHGVVLAIPFATLLYAAFAYPVAFLLGIPAYVLMSRLGSLTVLRVTLAGSVLGSISGAVLLVVLGADGMPAFTSGMYITAMIFAVWGAIAAWVFWWVALREHAGFERIRGIRP